MAQAVLSRAGGGAVNAHEQRRLVERGRCATWRRANGRRNFSQYQPTYQLVSSQRQQLITEIKCLLPELGG